MSSLEAIVERGTIRMKSTFEEARNAVTGMLKANKAGILAGFTYGTASRLFFNDHTGALPAMLTPLVTYARKYSWFNRFDSAGISAGGYFFGYAFTELVLRAVFKEFTEQIPTMPPQPSIFPEPEVPRLPNGIVV